MRLDRLVTQQRAPPHCQTARRLLLRGPAPTRAPLLHVGGPWRILPVGRPRHKQQRAFIHEVPALRAGGRAWQPSRARVAVAGHLHLDLKPDGREQQVARFARGGRGAFTPATAYLNEATTPSSPVSARGSRFGGDRDADVAAAVRRCVSSALEAARGVIKCHRLSPSSMTSGATDRSSLRRCTRRLRMSRTSTRFQKRSISSSAGTQTCGSRTSFLCSSSAPLLRVSGLANASTPGTALGSRSGSRERVDRGHVAIAN